MNIEAIKKEANTILSNKEPECSSIEYKSSEKQLGKILKTICAYGNNYYDNEISFLYIGVEEEASSEAKAVPKLPIIGIDDKRLEIAKNAILSLRPLIAPNVRFEVITNEFHGRKYLLVYVERQFGGPFSVTDKATRDKRVVLKEGQYIRIESDTRLANPQERYQLLRKFSNYRFSSEMSLEYTTNNLKLGLMNEYLSLTSKRELYENMSKEELVKILKLSPENETSVNSVKNYALLMFSTDPSQYIPYAYVEVITNTLGSMRRMESKEFKGPIWKQYYACLDYIRDHFIRTLTIREPNKANHREISNYPYITVRELLANAIVHKNYECGKTIQVYVSENEINIVNYNAPLPPLTLEDLNKGYVFHERDSANPEIRDMFKSLGIIESYGTGIGEAKKAAIDNGSDIPYYKVFSTDADITSVVIPANKEFLSQINEKLGVDNENLGIDSKSLGIGSKSLGIRSRIEKSGYSKNVKNDLIKIAVELNDRPFGAQDIAGHLGCSRNTAGNHLRRLMALGVLEPVKGLGKGKYRFASNNTGRSAE